MGSTGVWNVGSGSRFFSFTKRVDVDPGSGSRTSFTLLWFEWSERSHQVCKTFPQSGPQLVHILSEVKGKWYSYKIIIKVKHLLFDFGSLQIIELI